MLLIHFRWILTIFVIAFAMRSNCYVQFVSDQAELMDSHAKDAEIEQYPEDEHETFDAFNELTSMYDPETFSRANTSRAALQNLNDFVKELQVISTLNNVVQAVEKFLSLITLFDGVIGIFFKLFQRGDSEYDNIYREFNTIYEKIDALTYKMEEIEKNILIAIDWRPYKDQRHKVLAVSDAFELMSTYPNDLTFQMKFIESCKEHRMGDRLDSLEREMNGTFGDSMVHTLSSHFHMDFFLARSADVLTTATKAAFLFGVCLRNEQQILNMTEASINTYERISHDKVQSIVKSIRDGQDFIKKNYFAQVKKEVDEEVGKAGKMANDQFARSLYDRISAKYNWRTWFVSSYNGNTLGFKQHKIFAAATTYSARFTNRMVLVATPQDSTKASDSASIRSKFDHCLRPRRFSTVNGDDCTLLADELNECIRTSTPTPRRGFTSEKLTDQW